MADSSLVDALNRLLREESTRAASLNTEQERPAFNFASVSPSVSLSAYVVTGAKLHFRVASFTAGVTYTCTYRVLLPDGRIAGFRRDAITTGAYVTDTLTEILPECAILNAALYTTASLYRGQCYGRIILTGGYLANDADVWTLAQGYLTSVFTVSWPDGPADLAEQPPGYRVFVSGATPAPGAEVYEAPSYFGRVRLVSLHIRLITNATVNDRQVSLIHFSGANTGQRFRRLVTQPPSTSRRHRYQNVVAEAGLIGTDIYSDIGTDLWLARGEAIGTTTGNLAAGDQYSEVLLQYEVLHQF